MFVGTHAKVLESLTCVLGTTENQGVGASRSPKGELIQSYSLATCGNDAGTSCGSETQSSNGQLGDRQKAVVVGNSADNNYRALIVFSRVAYDAAKGDGWSVDLGHKQTSQDNLVEAGIGSTFSALDVRQIVQSLAKLDSGRTRQEAIKLHQELEVHIVALGGLAMGPLDVVAVEINTYGVKT